MLVRNAKRDTAATTNPKMLEKMENVLVLIVSEAKKGNDKSNKSRVVRRAGFL